MHQDVWDAVKTKLRWKFFAINAFIKKEERSQISNLTVHLKKLEKEEQKYGNNKYYTNEIKNRKQ